MVTYGSSLGNANNFSWRSEYCHVCNTENLRLPTKQFKITHVLLPIGVAVVDNMLNYKSKGHKVDTSLMSL